MSDKNIEIIKAIKTTGKCPETTTVKPTKMVTEGLEGKHNENIQPTTVLLNALIKKDN